MTVVPPLAEFVRQVNGLLAERSVNGPFWNVEPVFAELVQSGRMTDVVNAELQHLVDEPAYRSDGLSDVDVVLARSPRFTLTARIVNPTPAPIGARVARSSVEDYLMAVVGKGSAPIVTEWYEQPRPDPNTVFDRTRVLIPRGRRTLVAGEPVRVRAARDVVRIVPADEPSFVAVLASVPVAVLSWEYDLDSGVPARAVSGSTAASRLEATARLLGELGDPSCVPALAELAHHPHHFVRWAAVRAVAVLDPMRGVELLRRAVEDEHPHVRKAACAALRQIEQSHRSAPAGPTGHG
jgi:hypothetical protein